MESKWDKTQKRIMAILGQEGIDDIFRSDENLQVYLEYLKNNVEHPCLVTGMEDFPWEEKYVFGYGDEKEYEKLKVTTQVNKAGAGDEPASYELCLGVAVSIDVGING